MKNLFVVCVIKCTNILCCMCKLVYVNILLLCPCVYAYLSAEALQVTQDEK